MSRTFDAMFAGAFSILCLIAILSGDWIMALADATIALLLTRRSR
jgi:hypothetical protein